MAALNFRDYSWATWITMAGLAGVTGLAALRAHWSAAAAFACFFVLAAVFFTCVSHGGLVLELLFGLAAILNAAGWAWGLFRQTWGYDETVHAFTTFVITLYLSSVTKRALGGYAEVHRAFVTVAVVSFGVAAGALWEVVELAAGVHESRANSVVDLLMDTLGAGCAGLLSLWTGFPSAWHSEDRPRSTRV